MSPAELGARGTVGDGLPDQFAGVGAGLQQSDDVACDLAGVVPVDSTAQADERAGPDHFGIRACDRHPDVAGVVDIDSMNGHPLLALHARAIGDAELPVVPRAGEQVAVQLALGQAVALVRAGVVDGVDPTGRADEADTMAVDLDHAHRPVREIVEVGDGVEHRFCCSHRNVR